MSLFVAEGMFVYVYARYASAEAMLPINEPLATFCFGVLGLAIFILRRRRQKLAQLHVALQAELGALDRTRPVFAHAREELSGQLDAISEPLHSSADKAASGGVRRAADRLGVLADQLRRLIDTPLHPVTTEQAERALLDRDAHVAALTLAAVAIILAVPMTLWARTTCPSSSFGPKQEPQLCDDERGCSSRYATGSIARCRRSSSQARRSTSLRAKPNE